MKLSRRTALMYGFAALFAPGAVPSGSWPGAASAAAFVGPKVPTSIPIPVETPALHLDFLNGRYEVGGKVFASFRDIPGVTSPEAFLDPSRGLAVYDDYSPSS